MYKYRKLPIEIEAVKVSELIYYFGHNWQKLPKWVEEAYYKHIITLITDNYLYIKTLERKNNSNKK